jgi:hypothetical protein
VDNSQSATCELYGVEGHTYQDCPVTQSDENVEYVNFIDNESFYFSKPPFNRSYYDEYYDDPVEQQNLKWRQNQGNTGPYNNQGNNSFQNPNGGGN